MTRTTRPARPDPVTARPKTVAPRYPVLRFDVYRALDAAEKRRADLHAAIDVICDAVPRARLDRDSIGFIGSYRQTDGSRSTATVDAAVGDQVQDEARLNSVESASQRRDRAGPWLVQYARLRAAVLGAERAARTNWPAPLPPGTVISQDGLEVTVGARSNQVPVCSWCGDPALSGRHDSGRTKVSRVGDHVVHANAPYGEPNCYLIAHRLAIKESTTIAAVLKTRVAERRGS